MTYHDDIVDMVNKNKELRDLYDALKYDVPPHHYKHVSTFANFWFLIEDIQEALRAKEEPEGETK